MSIESTLSLLKKRFPEIPEADVNALHPTLNAIGDLNRLKALNLDASFVESFQAFRDRLET